MFNFENDLDKLMALVIAFVGALLLLFVIGMFVQQSQEHERKMVLAEAVRVAAEKGAVPDPFTLDRVLGCKR